MKFLVVDDSSSKRRIIANCLKKLGYDDVVEAESGVAALAEIAKGSVDLLITEWNLPGIDGLTLVKKVRADDRFKQIPILMLTTEAVKEDVIDALKAGVDSVIVKPFTTEVLAEKVKKASGSARCQDAKADGGENGE